MIAFIGNISMMDSASRNGRPLGRQLMQVNDLLQISPISHNTCLTFSDDDGSVAAFAPNGDDVDPDFSVGPGETSEIITTAKGLHN